jgi:hypothetical protein
VAKGKSGLFVSHDEIRNNKEYLCGLAQRKITPKAPEIVGSMKFFLKATSGQSTHQKNESELF